MMIFVKFVMSQNGFLLITHPFETNWQSISSGPISLGPTFFSFSIIFARPHFFVGTVFELCFGGLQP